MRELVGIVKELVLQGTSLQALENDLLHGGFRVQDSLRPFHQLE